MPVALAPDALPIVREFLAGHADVAALVAGRVHAMRLPDAPVFPCVLVTTIVDRNVVAQTTHAAAPRVQVEAFAGDSPHGEADARLLAATCHAALLTELDGYSHAAGHVTDVAEELGFQFVPDPDYQRHARCQFDVRVTCHRHIS